MRHKIKFLLFAAASTGIIPGSLVAQVNGRVMDPADNPVDGARVEAIGESGVTGTAITNGEGRFSFSAEIVSRSHELKVEFLGFREVIVPLLGDTRQYYIQLGEPLVPLEGLLVTSDREVCSLRDNREARALWESVQDRYQPARTLEDFGMASYVSAAISVGQSDPTSDLELPEVALGRHGSASLLRFSWRRRAEREGYAYRIRRNDTDQAYDSWAYAPLDADFAAHFVDASFGELNDFVLLESGGDGWSITFCPEDEDQPGIFGRLEIAADSTLTSAEWVFKTPDPNEDAGGKATFRNAAVRSGKTYLLPSESISWRRLPPGDFYKQHQRFEEWLVIPGDSVPFLPVRSTGDREVANR